jgi:hypothetical protein
MSALRIRTYFDRADRVWKATIHVPGPSEPLRHVGSPRQAQPRVAIEAAERGQRYLARQIQRGA